MHYNGGCRSGTLKNQTPNLEVSKASLVSRVSNEKYILLVTIVLSVSHSQRKMQGLPDKCDLGQEFQLN